jgi:glycosyltransferase involved in cell wall biosynthesis
MKKVLIVGMSNVTGGVESVMINIVRNIDKSKVTFDFLSFFNEMAFEEELENSGADVFHITRRGDNPLRSHFELRSFFIKHSSDYDFIWFNMSSASNLPPLKLAKKYTSAKIITHSHGTMFESRDGLVHHLHMLLHKINRKKLIKLTDIFFACSTPAGNWLFGKQNQKRVHIIKNSINTEAFLFDQASRKSIREELGIDGKFVIGHVGRFCYAKNQTFILEVFEELNKIRQDIHLIFVGDGEMFDKIKSRVTLLGLSDNVTFLGKRADVNLLMNSFDLFLMPSHFEGFPVTLIEAQANGLPCLVSSVVTKESQVTKLVTFHDLALPASSWAKQLNRVGNLQGKREMYKQLIDKEGYSTQSINSDILSIICGEII